MKSSKSLIKLIIDRIIDKITEKEIIMMNNVIKSETVKTEDPQKEIKKMKKKKKKKKKGTEDIHTDMKKTKRVTIEENLI